MGTTPKSRCEQTFETLLVQHIAEIKTVLEITAQPITLTPAAVVTRYFELLCRYEISTNSRPTTVAAADGAGGAVGSAVDGGDSDGARTGADAAGGADVVVDFSALSLARHRLNLVDDVCSAELNSIEENLDVLAQRACETDVDIVQRASSIGVLYQSLLETKKRKTSGTHLTPSQIGRSLMNCLDQSQKAGGTEINGVRQQAENTNRSQDSDGDSEAESQYRKVILDPAVGGAALLLSAAQHHLEAGGDSKEIARGLIGFDIDPIAVDISQAAVSLWTLHHNRPPEKGHVQLEIYGRFEVCDSLTVELPAADLVIANPPFLSRLRNATALDKVRQKQIDERWQQYRGPYTDESALFLIAAAQCLKEHGSLCVILPISVLASKYTQTIRSTIDKELQLLGIWVGPPKVFSDADVEVCAVIATKTSPGATAKARAVTTNGGQVKAENKTAAATQFRAATKVKTTTDQPNFAVKCWVGSDFTLTADPSTTPNSTPATATAASSTNSTPATATAASPRATTAGKSGISWSHIAARAKNVPQVAIRESSSHIGDIATVTAGFRDQFYGLIPYTREATDPEITALRSLLTSEPTSTSRPPRNERTPKPRSAPEVGETLAEIDSVIDSVMVLTTTGMIDALEHRWGTKTFRFAHKVWHHPVLDLQRLEEGDPKLFAWIQARRKPKIVVATQTKVIEAYLDRFGIIAPVTPTITIETHDESDLETVLAVLQHPCISAWLYLETFGTALSIDAIKVSASQLAALPQAPLDSADISQITQLSANPEELGRYLIDNVAICDTPISRDNIYNWWQQRL